MKKQQLPDDQFDAYSNFSDAVDKFVKECLNEFENELGEVSDEWELEDSVSDHISKILNICKPVCPNFDIDAYRGDFAQRVRASLNKLQMGKEQIKRAIELVNEQWAEGGGKKVCACTCMLCDCVSVCSCVYLVCTMSARVYI